MNASSPAAAEPWTLRGTRQIVAFNWPQYVVAMSVVVAGIALSAWVERGAFRLATQVMTALVAWWFCASLAASWWIYDASVLTRWRWLKVIVGHPRRWSNIHSGFDDTSRALLEVLPDSRSTIVDIYDRDIMSEPSIERARRRTPPVPGTVRGSWRRIPLDGASQDVVFLLFAAHELRRHDQRVALFIEAARVLDRNGIIVVVEHLRDLANFAAFGPGCVHFFSQKAWLRTAVDAGLRIRLRRTMTPFVTVYVLERV